MTKTILISFLLIPLFTQANNKPEEAIVLTRGQSITISLPSNSTTGYSWQLCSKNTRNTIVGVEELSYKPDESDLIGSGGTQTWKISGKKRGSAHIKFEYRRPWEKGQPPAKIKRYLFTVQ